MHDTDEISKFISDVGQGLIETHHFLGRWKPGWRSFQCKETCSQCVEYVRKNKQSVLAGSVFVGSISYGAILHLEITSKTLERQFLAHASFSI